MILSPGNVCYYFGCFLLAFGNIKGVLFGAMFMGLGFWLWTHEDDLDYEDDDTCIICCQESCDGFCDGDVPPIRLEK